MRQTRLKRFFLVILLVITLITLLAAYLQFKDEQELQYLKKEKELLEITNQLNDHLISYDHIIQEYNAESLDADGKTEILNKLLQPIINEIAEKNPYIGLGYYSKALERHVALGPQFDHSFLKKASSTDILVIYQTRKYRSLRIENPILWGGIPVFTVQLPLIRNGEMIGHAFANITIENINKMILKGTIKRIINIFLLWIFTVVLMSYIFRRLHYTQKEHLEVFLNSVSDSFYVLNKDMMFTYCNNGALKHFGCNPVGQKIWDAFPQSKAPQIVEIFEKISYARKSMYFEFISLVSNRWIGFNVYPSEDGGLLVFFRDIHEIKQANEQAKQAKERFLKAFNLNPNIMILISLDGKPTYLDVNDAFLKASGLERKEIIGRSISEFNLLADINQYAEVKKLVEKEKCITNYELVFRFANALRTGLLSAERFEISGIDCMLAVITDISEKKQLDKELSRFDSLNLVGEIAASIGHEVRNPMTTVRGYLQMFLSKNEFALHKERLETMIEELDRANSIITEFLSLAKNKTTQMKIGNLNNIINVLFPLIQADAFRLGHSVQVESNPVLDNLLDEKEIRQLILNLVRNALEAMEMNGLVKIKTYVISEEVVLEISDTGNGIPSDILDKIGTPFVTTKANGTGLGLSVCYRIAQRHKAKINVKTGSTGTTFLIHFPTK